MSKICWDTSQNGSGSLPSVRPPPPSQRSAYEVFKEYDTDRDSRLDQAELASMFKRFMPALTPGELRYVLGHMYEVDPNADGKISFKVGSLACDSRIAALARRQPCAGVQQPEEGCCAARLHILCFFRKCACFCTM